MGTQMQLLILTQSASSIYEKTAIILAVFLYVRRFNNLMYYKCYLQASTVLLFVLFEEIAPAKATTKFIINIVISISDWNHIRVNFACMPNIFTCCT